MPATVGAAGRNDVASGVSGGNAIKEGPLDRAELVARAAAESAAWRARLPASGPRLFFDAESWRSLRPRYEASTGRQRQLFDGVLARAKKIVARPTVAYRTPAEVMAASGMTPLDAEQELWQRPVGNGMVALALALALTGDAAVRDKLRDVVRVACTYPQWGCPTSHPNSDLACGHVARGVAVALDWHPDLFDAAGRADVLAAVRPRVNDLVKAACGGTFWAGHYDENHNHVSVCAVGVCGLAFFDEIDDAPLWTATALTNFERVAALSSPDGSSPEGVPYWSYGMSYTLQYIEAVRHTLGTARLYDAPYFRNSIATRLHASTPGLGGIAPWGDAPPRDYYGPQHLLYRLAAEYRDGVGQHLGDHIPYGPAEPDDAAWAALWYDPTLPSQTSAELDHHADHAGLVASRSGWGDTDYLLAFKAGFTNRNHSHLDAGAIALCVGPDWLLRTPGYGEGKGEKGFWDRAKRRWTYLSNATESHCTLLIDGRNQSYTVEARGTVDVFEPSAHWLAVGADLTGAYDGVRRVRRDLLHCRGGYVLVFDTVEADAAVKVEWLAQVPPDAEVVAGHLRAKGRAGAAEVQVVSPAGAAFAAREPTSEHVDVPVKRQRTYAATQSGPVVSFITAIFPPRPGGGAVPVVALDGPHGVTVTTAEGEDRVTVTPAAAGPPAFAVTRRTAAGESTVFSSKRPS